MNQMGTTDIPINGLTKVQIEDHNLSQLASRRASADPLPGPLADAFAKGAIAVGELKVRKVVASDWVTFKRIKSPVLEMVLEIQQSAGSPDATIPEVEFTDQQQWEMCWQFTHTPAEVRVALDDGFFSDYARRDIADAPDVQVPLIITAAMEQIKRSWQTAVKFAAGMEKDGEVTFFRDAEATRKMASDGGSSTSGD